VLREKEKVSKKRRFACLVNGSTEGNKLRERIIRSWLKREGEKLCPAAEGKTNPGRTSSKQKVGAKTETCIQKKEDGMRKATITTGERTLVGKQGDVIDEVYTWLSCRLFKRRWGIERKRITVKRHWRAKARLKREGVTGKKIDRLAKKKNLHV